MRLETSFRQSLEEMTASYETTLHEAGFEAAAYLKQRGIDKETAACYRLGVVNDKFPEHAQYAGMISIPYVTKLGGVVSLKFRRPHDCTETCQHGKYLSPYGTRLFNTVALERADREGYVCVTEGEIDAIILDHVGCPAVGIPGVDCWAAHPEWAAILSGYPRVFIFGDPDEPGRRLSKAIGLALGTSAKQVGWAADVNEYYVKQCGGDRSEFRNRVCERLGFQAG